ncbi:MAG: 2-dehydropantoate 2-reductase [Candidatus Omnitrophota bacterium]|nr:2-dehydropantoate 2-reductase [Candidatus Omnitrophota bacterium]
MKIAIIGAGAIGNLIAGYLKLKDADVSLVGKQDSVNAIKENGLQISGVRGNFNIKIDTADKLNYAPDLAILSIKTQDIKKAVGDNLDFLKKTLIVTTQNGICADDLTARYVPKENIISSIVMFGATYLEPAKVTHNFEGPWIIGRIFEKVDEKAIKVSQIFDQIFPTIVTEDIKGMKAVKIFVNANNCIPAILGISMQETFSDINTSLISIEIWREGLNIMNAAGIRLVSLPDFPVERIKKLTSLPAIEAAKIFSGIMQNLSKEPLYGSILQSIKRGKPSEIDYINGEFISLAEKNNLKAPLNKRLVEMVHQVEQTKRFFSREELLKCYQIHGLSGQAGQ